MTRHPRLGSVPISNPVARPQQSAQHQHTAVTWTETETGNFLHPGRDGEAGGSDFFRKLPKPKQRQKKKKNQVGPTRLDITAAFLQRLQLGVG